MDTQIENSLLIERLIAGLSTIFGCLATLLAMVGLYGGLHSGAPPRARSASAWRSAPFTAA
jgi:hypothetical protein